MTMAKKFTLEKVLYFTQKSDGKGFHVGPKDAKGTGTDLSGIIAHAKGNNFISENTKDSSGTYYGITDKGRVRLLFSKMIFNMQRGYSQEDLTKEVMGQITPVLENEGLSYTEFYESVTSALKRKFDSSENKKMNKLFNQFAITAPIENRSPIKKLRVEFEEFGGVVASYGPDMKPSIGNKAKSLIKRLIKGANDPDVEKPSFEKAENPTVEPVGSVEPKEPVKEAGPKSNESKKSSSSSPAGKPKTSSPVEEKPIDEAKVMKTLHTMFEGDSVFDDFHDEKMDLPDGVPIKTLLDEGFAKIMATDDVATYYEITPKGNDFAMRVKANMLASAGLPVDNIKSMLKPNFETVAENAVLIFNDKSITAPVYFDHKMPFGDYIQQGEKLMRELMPEAAVSAVNELHWDVAYEDQIPLYEAVKDIVDSANSFIDRSNKHDMVQPEKLRETAIKLHNEFLENLTPDQLKGALFMEVFKTTGHKISQLQMDTAVDGPKKDIEQENDMLMKRRF